MLFDHKTIQKITTVFAIFILSIASAQDVTVTITNVSDGIVEVSMDSNVDIGGFQFNLDDDPDILSVTGASGGMAGSAGFMMSSNEGGMVLGFSLTGATIPAGSGVLCNVEVDMSGESGNLSLSGAVFSDQSGNALSVEVGPDYYYGDLSEPHFLVDIESTGVNQLVIFQETITGLEVGDEIGVFDAIGLLSYGDCSSEYGELLVGAGDWTGEQLNLVGIGSVDNCGFGGIQLPGWVDDNSLLIKVWKADEEMEYEAVAEYSTGSGHFGDIILAISELNFEGGETYGCLDAEACNFDPSADFGCDDCCEYPEDFGWCDCDGNVEDCTGDCGGDSVEDDCGVCDGNNEDMDCAGDCFGDAFENECGCVGGGTGNEEDFCYGCTDPDAINYDAEATIDDGSCEYESGDNYLGFGELGESSFEIIVANSEAIGGFQFDITGVDITDAWGGLSEENGFMVSVGGNRVLGFSLTGASIPPGSGVLVNLDYTGSGEICIEGAILSTSGGEAMDVTIGDCVHTPDEDIYGCTDESACNYNPDATVDDDSCWHPEDEGWCDCDGNVEDCTGDCGGDSVEDDCGVCDGNNEDMDCAGDCFGDAFENECGCVGGGTGNEEDFCYGCTDPDAINYDAEATIDDGSCVYDGEAHFVINIDPTGVNQLVIFQETITSLEPGDEIGIFDASGLLSNGDCSGEYGEILVGAGEWTGEQLNLVTIGSIDNCSFGGIQLPGWVDGNSVVIKVWKTVEGMEYTATVEYSVGSGSFGEILIAVSELTIGGEAIPGCTDPDAENYNPDATIDDGSCNYEGSGTIGDEGGTVEDGDGSVNIPPGALNEDVEVSVEEMDEDDVPEVPEDMELNGPVFAFTPHGQEFSEPVTITIPYEEDAESLIILTLQNEEDADWEPLGGGSFEDGIAIIEVNHFSFYGVGYEVDCLGIPDGDAEYDECGVCDGPGPLTWYADVDDDGLGDPDVSIESCDQPVGYVDNPDDPEPDCATNDTDDCGVCAGDNSSCSGCMDPEAFNYDSDAVFDNGSCVYLPEEFEYSQSTLQAFYFITSADIDGESLEWGDWVGIYNGDIVTGAWYWEGPYTTVPAMGDDGSDYTDGYFEPEGIPSFRVFDASTGEIYIAVASENIAWENNGLFNLEINIYSDCNGDPGGTAYTDDCGECVGGNTGNDENWAMDCNDTCFGEAEIDDCGECSGGSTGHPYNSDMDCNEECFGEAFESDCGCVGGSTGLEDDYCFGCTDESAWNCPDCLDGNPDASLDDGSCIYTPDGFEFAQSTMQAFHFFLAATLDDAPLVEMEDWIGIYNGDVCVGSWPWQGVYTTVPSMGDDGSDWTEGYITPGVLPSYKVYDSSEDEFYNAIPSQEYPWANNEFFTIDFLEGMTFATYAIDLHTGSNLISFYALPEDASLSNVFADLGTNITGVIGEGIAAQQISPGVWVGSLETIDPASGYWAKMESPDVLNGTGIPTDPNVVYELHTGANLISFPFAGAIEIGAGIPDEVEPLFDGIIGEGIATQQVTPFNWVGSLVYWEGMDGYWAKVDEPLSFSFNPPTFARIDDEIAEVEESPTGFEYNQSTEQAFYFVEELSVPQLTNEMWLLAYCSETLIGAREWQGAYTDIPAMGDDGSPETAGYCVEGEIPVVKAYFENSGEIIELTGNISDWNNNELFTVTNLSSIPEIPVQYALHPAYPNPFNPQTTISYELPIESIVSVVVFDINGRMVVELIDSGSMTAGIHSVIWNAEELSTGVYFVKMIVNGQSDFIQKLLLIK